MSPSTDLRENREFASEIKFLVSPALADQIRDWARGRLAPDPNAAGESGDAYPVRSLYLDTERFDVFHRKGSFGRSKYRVRPKCDRIPGTQAQDPRAPVEAAIHCEA